MKRFGWVAMGVLLAAGGVWAGSPARVSAAVAASGSGAATLAMGSGIGFKPEAVVMPASAGSTQTVSFVMGSVTNTLGTKVAAANDVTLYLTNSPWLFDGDGVVVSTTATNGFTARIVGTMRR